MTKAYYNENDPKAAAWLRELIAHGHVAPGIVDERSIEDVLPSDLEGFTQCHFFAGIGGWSYALRLAGWPDDREVWTGSCPCQPFSAAGKGAGFADERHLWPSWLWLARKRRPGVIFGEQVANAMQWIDLVQGDLEAEGYACGYAVLGAHSVGAPHIRQRLYWVADSRSERRERGSNAQRSAEADATERGESLRDVEPCGVLGGMADASRERQQQHAQRDGEPLTGTEASRGHDADGRSGSGELAESQSEQHDGSRDTRGRGRQPADGGELGDADSAGPQGRRIRWDSTSERTTWSADLVSCRDGKWRPVEPGTFPLVAGVPGRVGLLRGYGNAIVPQVAAAFIRSYLDA